jgi:hypothetical protein
MASGIKRSVGIKKKDVKAEQESALQVAKMIINGVAGEMRQHNTLDDPSLLVLPSPARTHVLLRGSLAAAAVVGAVDPDVGDDEAGR